MHPRSYIAATAVVDKVTTIGIGYRSLEQVWIMNNFYLFHPTPVWAALETGQWSSPLGSSVNSLSPFAYNFCCCFQLKGISLLFLDQIKLEAIFSEKSLLGPEASTNGGKRTSNLPHLWRKEQVFNRSQGKCDRQQCPWTSNSSSVLRHHSCFTAHCIQK